MNFKKYMMLTIDYQGKYRPYDDIKIKIKNGITDAMRDYVRPLVQGQAPITIDEDGLPLFMRFERKPLEKKLPEYFSDSNA